MQGDENPGSDIRDRINIVADLLMGAAHADGHLGGLEEATVKRILRELLGLHQLPMDLEFRLKEFNPATLDLAEAAKAFADDTPAEKRRLLELLATLTSADGEHDLAEDAFIRKVGLAIGLDEALFRDLCAAIIEDRALGLSREMPAVRLTGSHPKVK